MKHLIKLLALIIALALGVVAFAHDKHKQPATAKTTAAKTNNARFEFIGKGDGIKTCPVTGEEIPSKDIKAVLFGRTVYFCCPSCLDDAKKTPAAYIKRTYKAQLLAIKNVPKSEDHDHGHHAEEN